MKRKKQAIVVVKIIEASERRGRRHVKARIVGYGVVVGVKTPGIRAWAFDRTYAWTPSALRAINVALDVAWRDAMRVDEVAA